MSTSPSKGLFIGITCDGNRRDQEELLESRDGLAVSKEYLSAEHLYEAYKRGGDAVKNIIEIARDQSVGIIAPWIWSRNNWSRKKEHAHAVFKVAHEFLEDLKQNWVDLPQNKDVRLAHMGRRSELLEAIPDTMHLLQELCEYTRERTGMVVALCMDYSGPDERERAIARWSTTGRTKGWQASLDLPTAGIPYKEVDLRIRTGELDRAKHINAFLNAYEGDETREIFREEYLPSYTPDLFLEDLAAYNGTEKRSGK